MTQNNSGSNKTTISVDTAKWHWRIFLGVGFVSILIYVSVACTTTRVESTTYSVREAGSREPFVVKINPDDGCIELGLADHLAELPLHFELSAKGFVALQCERKSAKDPLRRCHVTPAEIKPAEIKPKVEPPAANPKQEQSFHCAYGKVDAKFILQIQRLKKSESNDPLFALVETQIFDRELDLRFQGRIEILEAFRFLPDRKNENEKRLFYSPTEQDSLDGLESLDPKKAQADLLPTATIQRKSKLYDHMADAAKLVERFVVPPIIALLLFLSLLVFLMIGGLLFGFPKTEKKIFLEREFHAPIRRFLGAMEALAPSTGLFFTVTAIFIAFGGAENGSLSQTRILSTVSVGMAGTCAGLLLRELVLIAKPMFAENAHGYVGRSSGKQESTDHGPKHVGQ